MIIFLNPIVFDFCFQKALMLEEGGQLLKQEMLQL
jgi:hypothetical protein